MGITVDDSDRAALESWAAVAENLASIVGIVRELARSVAATTWPVLYTYVVVLRRYNLYLHLRRFLGVREAHWIAWHLPEAIVMRLPWNWAVRSPGMESISNILIGQ